MSGQVIMCGSQGGHWHRLKCCSMFTSKRLSPRVTNLAADLVLVPRRAFFFPVELRPVEEEEGSCPDVEDGGGCAEDEEGAFPRSSSPFIRTLDRPLPLDIPLPRRGMGPSSCKLLGLRPYLRFRLQQIGVASGRRCLRRCLPSRMPD